MQRRLDELRGKIDNEAVDAIVARLNEPGKDRVAAMWEVVVLHGLATTGDLESENALPSGRRPDVWFDGDVIRFVADVTSVSDDGLDVKIRMPNWVSFSIRRKTSSNCQSVVSICEYIRAMNSAPMDGARLSSFP